MIFDCEVSLEGRDILGISLFSISKKIYAINGVYNNVNTQYVITTGVYSGSSTTTRQYY